MRFEVDLEVGALTVHGPEGPQSLDIGDPAAFQLLSKAWLRCGWDTKYVYGFSWLGRPIIQLPDDMVRIQEVIYDVQPDVIVETGIAHGGSLVFYASLCVAMGHGEVVGIDLEIRPHNREAIERHRLFEHITLFEGSSTEPSIVEEVAAHVAGRTALVILDSNHSHDHVLEELRSYGPLVTPGSYIVATDGIMQDLVGAPRSADDWGSNNPQAAVRSFLAETDAFELVEPTFPFNEGLITGRVTYWPSAYLRRRPAIEPTNAVDA
jgi:cephalosporin hydroxylase